MKPTNFAKYLTDFLGKYLDGERGCSSNTISAYRDAMTLFLIFMRDTYSINADKIDFKDIMLISAEKYTSSSVQKYTILIK